MVMASFSIAEPRRLSDIVRYELDARYTRDSATLLAGSGSDREIGVGDVLGKVLFGTPTAVKAGTGNGTMTGPTLKARAQVGDYVARCIAAASNAGTFAVFDPLGRRMADATVAVAYDNGEIGFTIADGGTDWIVGDTWTITVPEGSGKVVAYDQDAVNGAQRFWGIAIADFTAPDGVDLPGAVAVVRGPAVAITAELGVPSDLTDGELATLRAEMLAAGILTVDAY